MEKLYRIKTTGQMTALTALGQVQSEVCVYWFRDGRVSPAVSYSESIPGWDDMSSALDLSKRDLEYAQRLRSYVDQLFTKEEVDAIKGYFLQTNALETVIEEIDLPVTDFEISFRSIPPPSDAGEGYGFIELYGVQGYPLPFKVCGFFDVVYDNPYERYQNSVVKSLLESAGFGEDEGSDIFYAEARDIGEKLKQLHSVLLDIQRALNGLNRRLSADE